jgi:hypothetical protein
MVAYKYMDQLFLEALGDELPNLYAWDDFDADVNHGYLNLRAMLTSKENLDLQH